MIEVVVREREPIESAIRRFKKECDQAGILQELKRREFYQKPSVLKHQKEVENKRKMKKYQEKINEFYDKFDKILDNE